MAHGRGMSYVSIAISLIITLILIITTIMLLTGNRRGRGSEPEAAIPRAQGVECLSRIRKFETAVAMFNADSGYYPLQLTDVPELECESFFCPVTHEPYQYDRETGRVKCSYHH
jgi:hypothetical protein